MLRDLLENKKCFKLILGAGNENLEAILPIVKTYYELGCRFFDLSPNTEIIKNVKKIAPEALICVSFGVNGDKHIQKAIIDKSKCNNCGLCSSICPYNGILDIKNCIGCVKCLSACSYGAIKMENIQLDFEERLNDVVKLGIHNIELHAQGADFSEIKEKWELISDKFKGILSVCLQVDGIEVATKLIEKRIPYTTIIQADGKSMTGTVDNNKTTIPAIECAKAFMDKNLPAYILLSGGTNSKTVNLIKKCGLTPNGVSYGSYARKLTDKNQMKALIQSVSFG